jgi:hypothetical protein
MILRVFDDVIIFIGFFVEFAFAFEASETIFILIPILICLILSVIFV